MTNAREIDAATDQFVAAINRLLQGDATPVLACWSEADDVTYLDPQGALHRGHTALVAYYRRAAHLNAAGGPTATRGETTEHVSGDLAFVVIAEHVTVPQADGTATTFTAHSTNGFRREDGAWKVIHRHSGAPLRESSTQSSVRSTQ